jgi:hypothetical protein
MHALVEKISLAGVLPAPALLSQLDAGLIASPSNRVELLAMWERSNRAYQRVGPASRSFSTDEDLRPLEGVTGDRVERIAARLKNYPPFDAHPTRILLANVRKLVTPQLTVTIGRMERRAKFAKRVTADGLFDMAFGAGSDPEPVFRQTLGLAPNGGALIFTSSDEDIRLHHPPQFRSLRINQNDTEGPELESICFPVGGGTPFVQVLRIQMGPGLARLILANGIHRVAAAARAGVEWFPAATCDLSPVELPDQFVDLPKALLLDPNFNAPLAADFADESVAIHLQCHRQLRTVRFNWNFENYSVGLR